MRAASDNEINTTININDLSDVDNSFYVEYKVPISGWNANFNPLLSMPLVDLGQPAESWNAQYQSDFMDASTANTYTWDFSMLGVYPNASTGTVGTIGDSNLITVADSTSGTNTVTAITAKQDITLYAVISNELPNTGGARWYDSNDDVIVQGSVNGANASGFFPVQVHLSQVTIFIFGTKILIQGLVV